MKTFEEFLVYYEKEINRKTTFGEHSAALFAWKTSLPLKKDAVTDAPCNDGLCSKLSLMLDIFNSCIEVKKFPLPGSPCQKRILKLLKQSGRKPSASK